MKIAKIDIDAVRVRRGSSWVFARIHTDEGLVGLGELNPSASREDCIRELQRIGAYALGKDPRRIEAFGAGLEPAQLGRYGVHALAALEQALWDILGQSLGTPVYQLMGGKCCDEQRLYANITRATDGLEPEGFVESAKEALADGFDAVKIAPFALGETAQERAVNIERGIECARRLGRRWTCYWIATGCTKWKRGCGLPRRWRRWAFTGWRSRSGTTISWAIEKCERRAALR